MQIRRARAATVAVALAISLAGCGATSDSTAGDADARPAVSPVSLIGTWEIQGTNEPDATVMTVTPGQFHLWRDCGYRGGTWLGRTDGQLVASINTTSGRCKSIHTPAWLRDATAFRVADGLPVLLGADGRVTARLTPAARPTPPKNIADFVADVPTVTPSLRAAYEIESAPLPEGIVAADHGSLVGQWEKAGGAVARASRFGSYVMFKTDRTWGGSDGCNGRGGLWLAGERGALTATGGAGTMIGCPAQVDDVTGFVPDAARAGFDGRVLVLYDRAGSELVRLQPAIHPSADDGSQHDR